MFRKTQLAICSAVPILAAALLGSAGAQEVTDPETCRELWEEIGLPSIEKDFGEGDFVHVCHDGFLTLHNNTTKTPDWVLQRMTAEQVSGDNHRPKKSFVQETEAPEDRRAKNQDYTHSDFARGHQAASEDYNFDLDMMKGTFVYSNALPQIGAGFNSGVWSGLEGLVRDVARSRGVIYVISGPVYQPASGDEILLPATSNPCGAEIRLPAPAKQSICDANDDDATVRCEAGVAVPAGLFKIIYDPARQRANAYLLPNLNHSPLKDGASNRSYLPRFRVSVRLLEEIIETDMLTALSSRQQRVIEESCPASFFH